MTTRYATIYADPPWEFKTRSAKGKGRSAEAHYDCMPTPRSRPCRLRTWRRPPRAFLWTTNPVLPQALDVMAAWGFTFKAVAFCWVKRTKHGKWHFGGGHWTRANAELCLLGVRGEPKRVSCPGRVARPFGFALTDPGRRLSRTRLFPEVTRIGPLVASRGE